MWEVKHIHFYDTIAKKLKKEEYIINLFIAAFIDDPNTWIGDICLNLSHYIDLKEKREGHIANLSYTFKRNCIMLMQKGMKFNDTLQDFIFAEFMASEIDVETFIIFKKIFNFTLDKNINYDYIYRGKYEKYEFLLNVDIEKYKNLLKESIMVSGD